MTFLALNPNKAVELHWFAADYLLWYILLGVLLLYWPVISKMEELFLAANITHSTNFVCIIWYVVWKEIPAHLLDEALLQDDDAEPLGCE